MGEWSEIRGHTLRYEEGAATRWVRLALCSRSGLFGTSYNVREARAESGREAGPDASAGVTPTDLGIGRLLSWRWQARREAEELLTSRVRTLAALGYLVIETRSEARGPWDWLADLVKRQLRAAPAEGVQERRAPELDLLEVLSPLGLSPDAILEGVAQVLAIPGERVREPTAATVGVVDPGALGLLLPFLLLHGSPDVQRVGRRWLEIPSTAYEVDPDTVAEWLQGDGPLAAALVDRMAAEGLALLGPARLRELARRARNARTRDEAMRWVERLAPGPELPR